MKQFAVYILTNKWNQVFYTGVTNNLKRRIFEHKEKLVEGFTKRYSLTKLVYFELCNNPKDAITREKQIKAGSREKKRELIISINPDFKDLYQEIL